MSKILVVYWSGTGNTEAMAKAVAKGIGDAGAEADLFYVSDIEASAVKDYDKIAFGCPSMGSEVLEESEFEPFFTDAEASLSGKQVLLFGSYDWGDGQWMRDWADRVNDAGAVLLKGEGYIANNTPGDDELASCEALGRELASL